MKWLLHQLRLDWLDVPIDDSLACTIATDDIIEVIPTGANVVRHSLAVKMYRYAAILIGNPCVAINMRVALHQITIGIIDGKGREVLVARIRKRH